MYVIGLVNVYLASRDLSQLSSYVLSEYIEWASLDSHSSVSLFVKKRYVQVKFKAEKHYLRSFYFMVYNETGWIQRNTLV